MVRLLGAAAACLVALSLSACGTESSDGSSDPSAVGTTTPATAPTDQPTEVRPTPGAEPTRETAPAGLEELPAGYDESPDGALPAPDDDLTDAELTGLLRTRASAHGRSHCGPEDVEVSLVGFDMSLGHRFTTINVLNVSGRTCTIEGTPGIGVRGDWGTTFVPEVGAGSTSDVSRPIELTPAASATSTLEWTGSLAGAESEHASLVVVQLAQGQVPASVPAYLAGDRSQEPLDIGAFTSLRLTPFVPKR